jgi:chemotaxis protein methyltransferase CheR
MGLDRLVAWIEAELGLCFPEVHHDTIFRFVSRRCEELGIGVEAYLRLLEAEEAEKGFFIDEVTIGETYFFRDERHFSVLSSEILPRLLGEGRELRLWSATCATGEEAVSLVAVVEDARARLGFVSGFEVLASDISAKSLAFLEAGRFPASSFRSDGKGFHPLLERCGSASEDWWQASSECLSRIRAKRLNILSGKLWEPASIDVVFFRNTLLYMQQRQKEQALARVAQTLRPGGYLFLASPEVPTVRHPLLEIEESGGCFYFRRAAASPLDGSHKLTLAQVPPHPDPAAQVLAPLAEGAASGRVSDRQRPSAAAKGASDARGARSYVGAAELETALDLASARLRPAAGGERETAEAGLCAELASTLEAIVDAIHANRFDEADGLLDGFEALARENYLSQYLRALARKHQGSDEAALELWERALVYERRFWPAAFQAGLIYSKSNPERGRVLLRECLKLMGCDPIGDRYLVLLEGFGLPYYRRMAERLLSGAGKGTSMEALR